jgi:hypothetical protein
VLSCQAGIDHARVILTTAEEHRLAIGLSRVGGSLP